MIVIKKEMLSGNHYKGDSISGAILLKEVRRQMTKTQKPFFIGTLTSGVDIPFKAWDMSMAFKSLESYDLEGKVVYISGNWDDYNGQLSIILDSVTFNDELNGINPMDFLPVKYDTNAYWEGLKGIVGKCVSEKGMAIANKVLFENPDLAEEFKNEFAAKSHHDNCRGGLLAHTYKICYMMQVTLAIYKDICDRDLLMLGCLFHDIGKVREMNMGVYQPCSKVTHRFLGIEMLDKDLIVKTYGIDWYYELVSIMLQHHGEYGDPCRTVSARLVNLVDEFEAKVMLLKQSVDNSENCGVINVDGAYLSYMPK